MRYNFIHFWVQINIKNIKLLLAKYRIEIDYRVFSKLCQPSQISCEIVKKKKNQWVIEYVSMSGLHRKTAQDDNEKVLFCSFQGFDNPCITRTSIFAGFESDLPLPSWSSCPNEIHVTTRPSANVGLHSIHPLVRHTQWTSQPSADN